MKKSSFSNNFYYNYRPIYAGCKKKSTAKKKRKKKYVHVARSFLHKYTCTGKNGIKIMREKKKSCSNSVIHSLFLSVSATTCIEQGRPPCLSRELYIHALHLSVLHCLIGNRPPHPPPPPPPNDLPPPRPAPPKFHS